MKHYLGPSRISLRRIWALLAAGALLLLGPLSGPVGAAPVADAQTIVDSLLEHEGLYVHSQASRRFDDAVLERLRTARDSGRLPVYVIVLPTKAAPADAAAQDELLRQVAQGIGRSGTYILQAGPALRVHSTALTQQTVDRLTAQARSTGRGGAVQTLIALTGLAAQAKQETSAPGPHADGGKVIPPAPKEDDGGGLVLLLAAGGVLVAALAGIGFWLLRKRGKDGKGGAPAAGRPADAPQPDAPQPGAPAPAAGQGPAPAQVPASGPAQAPAAPQGPPSASGPDGAPPAGR
ncbi:hypothetical protein [Thermomonospora catenispora]|uniref:hypothetical protein n=1 Tax=Thermomonospora catenispora TaxID=2493090 RepID=UPI001123E62E|nr:hypothetical protein [Thermomonospora catenispora]TNY37215.1 hypothetical protein EIO00_08705 [Thermomonospora catenispora]